VRATSLRRTTETVIAGWGSEGTEFRFAALGHLQDSGVFDEIWQVAGRAGLHPLVDDDAIDRAPTIAEAFAAT